VSDRQQRGLPQRGGRAFSSSLDSLTDPGTIAPVRAVPSVRSAPDTSGTSVTRDTEGASGTPNNLGNSGNSGAGGTSGVVSEQAPGPVKATARQHVKLRGELAEELRDAVWFLGASTRPRVQLGELLDEAVGEWLAKVKAEYNDGADFPRKGRLR